MRYIGLTGFQGVGKSTLAWHLSEILGPKAVIRPFADPLKNLASAMYDVKLEYFHDWKLKDARLPESGCSPRELLLNLSKALKSQYGDEVILRLYKNELRGLPEDSIVIIPDVRLDVEVHWLHDVGGNIVAVKSLFPIRYKQKNEMDVCLEADMEVYIWKLSTGEIDPSYVHQAALHIKDVLEI